MIKHVAFPILIFCLSSCSAEPDGGVGGACSIECSSAKLGSSDFAITQLSPDINIACGGTVTGTRSLSGPLVAQFKITKTVNQSVGGEESSREVPVSNISIEPQVLGIMDDAATTAEFKASDGSITPYKYAGIATPSAEWCSDSCGVVTLEIQPLCVQDAQNEVSVSIQSGALHPSGDNNVLITVSHETPSARNER